MDESPATDPQTGLPAGYEPPAPSRDDTRNPRERRRPRLPRSGPGNIGARSLLRIGFVAGAVLLGLISGNGNDEPGPGQPPEPATFVSSAQDPQLVAYLDRLAEICQRFDRRAGPEMVPVDSVVNQELRQTAAIASVPAPAAAATIRARLLHARRRVDAIAVRTFRLMQDSEHPHAAYRKHLKTAVAFRVAQMYGTFDDYGIDCDVRTD